MTHHGLSPDIVDAEIKQWESDKRVLYPDSEVLASLGRIRAHVSRDAAARARYTLDGLLSGMAPENLHPEFDAGPQAAKPAEPFAWVIGRDNNANDKGFIDAMAWREGEFTTPLYLDAAQGSGYPAEEYAKVALGNAVEVGRLEILVARMERAVKAANAYYGCYVQDEAEEIECCISPEQHEAAKELRDALREATLAMTSEGR